MDALLARRARTARPSAVREILRLVEQPHVLSMAGGLPAPDCLPAERLQAAADRVLGEVGPLGHKALQYGPSEGDDRLRALLAERYGAAVDQVLVTTGSQQGLDLVARCLLDPGDIAVVEQPGYLGAIQALRASEPELVGIEVDDDGIRTDLLEARLVGGLRPKLVYTVPNFQNPTGAVLSEPRRRHLAALADRFGFLIVEDDPYGELFFDGHRAPSLRTLTVNVVALGSSSKVVAPGLRVGWLVAPDWLSVPLLRLKQATDLHTSSLSQRMVATVLADEPFMAAHLDRIRGVYRSRAAVLLDALPSSFRARPVRGGLFVWGSFVEPSDTTALLHDAVDAGVAFVPGAAFRLDDAPSAELRLSFATLSDDGLRTAADRLGQVAAAAFQRSFAGNMSSR